MLDILDEACQVDMYDVCIIATAGSELQIQGANFLRRASMRKTLKIWSKKLSVVLPQNSRHVPISCEALHFLEAYIWGGG